MSLIHVFLSLNFVFHQKSSSTKICLRSKFILYSINGHLALKIQRSSSIKGCFPSRSSSIKGCLWSKVAFHQILNSFQGCLPFCCNKCALKCCRMIPYHLLLPKPLYKLIITNRQADKKKHLFGHRLVLCQKLTIWITYFIFHIPLFSLLRWVKWPKPYLPYWVPHSSPA